MQRIRERIKIQFWKRYRPTYSRLRTNQRASKVKSQVPVLHTQARCVVAAQLRIRGVAEELEL